MAGRAKESMNEDISGILESWPHQPGQPNVRLVLGADGRELVQVRLELGLIQMEMDGRPDGQMPFGFPGLLEYYESALDQSADQPEDEQASLSADDCRLLRDEAVQYYHRYMALLALEDFDGVIRDTTRNLRVLDLLKQYAENESDRQSMESLRPYIVMVRTRALASRMLADSEAKAAVLALDQGLEALRQYFAETGRPQMFEESGEVQMLRGMREALVPKLPVSQKAELKMRLDKAVADENYELAAMLRDELKSLKE